MSTVDIPNKAPVVTSRPREVWVDVARCVAMFFIIWLHTGKSPMWNGQLVGGALCLFFVFAGYFMPRGPRRCATRALQMLWLWVFWSLASVGLYMLSTGDTAITWQRVIGWGVGAYNTPLWFLRNLAVYQLLIAGMLAIGLLPKRTWYLTVLLASFYYFCEYKQHVSLRFDWMMAVMLGVSLRTMVDLPTLSAWLKRQAVWVLGSAIILLVQIHVWPVLGDSCDWAVKDCSLPMESLAFMLLYIYVSMGLAKMLPRVAGWLAVAGGCMIFCYILHSYALAPFYIHPEWNFAANCWVPPLILLLLTWLHLGLQRLCPKAMRILFLR